MTDECWSHLLRCEQGAEEGSLEEGGAEIKSWFISSSKEEKRNILLFKRKMKGFFFSLYKTEDLPLQRNFPKSLPNRVLPLEKCFKSSSASSGLVMNVISCGSVLAPQRSD